MALTKEQCQEILHKAADNDACLSNYDPALKAFLNGDYDTFEQICRGNYDWLTNRLIIDKSLLSQEGFCLEYGVGCKNTYFSNKEGAILGLRKVAWANGSLSLFYYHLNDLVIFVEYDVLQGCKIDRHYPTIPVPLSVMLEAMSAIEAELKLALTNQTPNS